MRLLFGAHLGVPAPREPGAGRRRLRAGPHRPATGARHPRQRRPGSRPAEPVHAPRHHHRDRRAGLRQALHMPLSRLDVRQRRTTRVGRLPRQLRRPRPFDARPRPLHRRRAYRGFVFGTLAPSSPSRSTTWLGAATGVSRRARRPASRRSAARAAERAARSSTAATGSWRGTTPPTDCTRRTPTARTTSSVGRPTTQTVLERDPASTPMFSKVLGRGHVVVDQRPGIPAGPWRTMRPLPFADGTRSDRCGSDSATPPTPSSTSPRGAWSTSACSRT